jgi:hypothetical protein
MIHQKGTLLSIIQQAGITRQEFSWTYSKLKDRENFG